MRPALEATRVAKVAEARVEQGPSTDAGGQAIPLPWRASAWPAASCFAWTLTKHQRAHYHAAADACP